MCFITIYSIVFHKKVFRNSCPWSFVLLSLGGKTISGSQRVKALVKKLQNFIFKCKIIAGPA